MALLILFCFSDARAAPGLLLLNAHFADQVVHMIFNHPRKSLPRKIPNLMLLVHHYLVEKPL